MPDDVNPVESDGTVVFEKPITDHKIHSEVNLLQGEKIKGAKVIVGRKDPNGETVGKYNNNPLFNSMLYGVELSDSTNNIAENMYVQVDAEGCVQI